MPFPIAPPTSRLELRAEREDGGIGFISNPNGAALLSLAVSDVRELFKEQGALLFRGFDVDPWTMKSFAHQFSSRFNRDRLREVVEGSDGFVQMVTEGMGYVDPHSEQANSPFRPDAIWFCCETPAAAGGETLLWNGVELWRRLDPALQRLFRSKKLRFFQHYDRSKWNLFLGGGAALADARRLLDGIDGVSYYVDKDEGIYLEYVCSPVVRTRYGQEEAFANSLLSERKNTLGELMSFEDGTMITDAMVDEVLGVLNELTEPIAWQQGDLAFIDNSKFLHGRNAFTDVNRKIYSSLSFLNF